MISKIAILFATFIATASLAAFEPQQLRAGLTLGQVMLMGDVGDYAGNSMGFGVNLGYQINPEWALEAQHLRSSHDNLKHVETSFGLNYYFTDDPIFLTYVNFGVNFIANEMTVAGAPAPFDESGIGVFGGIGMDFLVAENVAAGLQLRYNKAFEVTRRDTFNGVDRAIIQDFATLLVRIVYIFN